jgi:hypothetical protein
MEAILFKVLTVALALAVGALVSATFAKRTVGANRSAEWSQNEKSDELSVSQLHWTVVHIRDDIGGIHNLLILTNALLAGLLAALIF